MSSIALYDKVHELRPDLIPVLKSPDWFHTWSNAQDLFQPPWFRYPIFGDHPQYFAAGANRKNTDGAQRDFSEIPRLTPIQVEALDLLDKLMPSDELCYSMELERGDMQLLDSFVTLHFKDYEDPDDKRHLMRLWLSVPTSQPFPPAFAEFWGDIRAGLVRGGVRGNAITPQFLAYEKGQTWCISPGNRSIVLRISRGSWRSMRCERVWEERGLRSEGDTGGDYLFFFATR